MPIIRLKIFKLNLCNSLINRTLCMKLRVPRLNTQVQILTDNFLLALDSCAPFEVKLIKRPPASWMTENIKDEINKKYNLSHEYKSIVEDNAKLQKETEYKQQKMVIRKLTKKSKMRHYHEALKNARTNPNHTWDLLRQLVHGKSKCKHLQQLFLQQRGKKRTTTRNKGIRPMDLMCRLGMREHIMHELRESPSCEVINPYKRLMQY